MAEAVIKIRHNVCFYITYSYSFHLQYDEGEKEH